MDATNHSATNGRAESLPSRKKDEKCKASACKGDGTSFLLWLGMRFYRCTPQVPTITCLLTLRWWLDSWSNNTGIPDISPIRPNLSSLLLSCSHWCACVPLMCKHQAQHHLQHAPHKKCNTEDKWHLQSLLHVLHVSESYLHSHS